MVGRILKALSIAILKLNNNNIITKSKCQVKYEKHRCPSQNIQTIECQHHPCGYILQEKATQQRIA